MLLYCLIVGSIVYLGNEAVKLRSPGFEPIERIHRVLYAHVAKLRTIFLSSIYANAFQQRYSRPPQKEMSKEEAYEVLGLQDGCKKAEIIKAFRHLAKINHPDAGGSAYIMRQITKAKDILINSIA